MEIKQYKRTFFVEAIHWNGKNLEEVLDFIRTTSGVPLKDHDLFFYEKQDELVEIKRKYVRDDKYEHGLARLDINMPMYIVVENRAITGYTEDAFCKLFVRKGAETECNGSNAKKIAENFNEIYTTLDRDIPVDKKIELAKELFDTFYNK